MSRPGEQRRLELTSTLRVGVVAPRGWVAAVTWGPDESLGEVLAALDAALAQLRAQLELDIRETMR